MVVTAALLLIVYLKKVRKIEEHKNSWIWSTTAEDYRKELPPSNTTKLLLIGYMLRLQKDNNDDRRQ